MYTVCICIPWKFYAGQIFLRVHVHVSRTCRVADALKMLNRVTCMYFEHSPFFLGVAATGERSNDC